MQDNKPEIQLIQMILGGWVSQIIHVAAKLGIADNLENGPQTVEKLAEATQSHEPSLARLLRALASIGVLTQLEDGRYKLTSIGIYLAENTSSSLRYTAILYGQVWHREAWSYLEHSIRTGEPAFDFKNGISFFEYLEENPGCAEIFGRGMTSLAGNMNGAILESYDFSRYEKIVDVGGGFGSFMMELLSNYPHLRGVIYDLPGVVDTARQIIDQRGMSERCECIQGNFFESIPTGADVYIMKLIIHDWNDEKSFTILKNCRQAMRPDNILLVMDQVLPPGNSPSPGKLTDLEMMIMVGGMERSESEFRTLFAKAGFEVMRIIPTSSPLMVIEAKSV